MDVPVSVKEVTRVVGAFVIGIVVPPIVRTVLDGIKVLMDTG